MTAHRVRILGGSSAVAAAAFAACFLAAVAASVRWAALPSMALWIYALASVVTFAAYGIDKSAAAGGRRRISERTLHLLALVGGWPGALVAQRAFRHKTQKLPFKFVLWMIVAAHCAALAWWVTTGRGAPA